MQRWPWPSSSMTSSSYGVSRHDRAALAGLPEGVLAGEHGVAETRSTRWTASGAGARRQRWQRPREAVSTCRPSGQSSTPARAGRGSSAERAQRVPHHDGNRWRRRRLPRRRDEGRPNRSPTPMVRRIHLVGGSGGDHLGDGGGLIWWTPSASASAGRCSTQVLRSWPGMIRTRRVSIEGAPRAPQRHAGQGGRCGGRGVSSHAPRGGPTVRCGRTQRRQQAAGSGAASGRGATTPPAPPPARPAWHPPEPDHSG